MLRSGLAALALSGACLTLAASAQAESARLETPWTQLHASRVRLVAGPAGESKGQHLAGLEITLEDGWKTYWRMPGDSGVPPSFDWSGSGNLAKAVPLYPAPTRLPEAGGYAIGYKGTVVLPIRIAPQDKTKPVNLKLALEFGVCREICIPATATFQLSLPPGSTGAPLPEIASALDRVPRPQDHRRESDPKFERAGIDRSGPSPKLVIDGTFAEGTKKADVFVEAPEGLYVPVPKPVATLANGKLRFEAPLGADLAQDLAGKTLTFTLVSNAGASEARWPVH